MKLKQVHPYKAIFCILYIIILFAGAEVYGQAQDVNFSYTVSMENPATHYFHVELECKGIKGATTDFRMPAWTPGYYWILDFAKNVANFSAKDGGGDGLPWKKTSLNTWQVTRGKSGDIHISYDVFAFNRSVAEPFLDDGRAFISPTGVFMFIEEYIHEPVKIQVIPYNGWENVNTGLDRIEGEKHSFYAGNFDVLFDCPILAGNHEVLTFETDGIPYTLAVENWVESGRETYINDLKKIITTATGIIGEVPYKHYTFLIMGQGYGGLEHRNSMAVFSNSSYDITNSRGYKDWLAFIAHEFFHLYNVKRIRPVELGPFDYSHENPTEMLWVAEGFTVYYEYLVLNRAGLINREETLEKLSRVIATFENKHGRQLQPATQSSFDTWLNFFDRNNHTFNTTISYYDIGCALGMLLDLKIRRETGNAKSLDDVMRTLYFDFHKNQNRGFTGSEFRDVCEKVAGCPLDELFEYASTTKPFDYQKYLLYAGIEIDTAAVYTDDAGAIFQTRGGSLFIRNVQWSSPAWDAGLSVDDEVLYLNGEKASQELAMKLIKENPGDEIVFTVKRRTGEKTIKVKPGKKAQRGFRMNEAQNISAKQKELLDSWLIF